MVSTLTNNFLIPNFWAVWDPAVRANTCLDCLWALHTSSLHYVCKFDLKQYVQQSGILTKLFWVVNPKILQAKENYTQRHTSILWWQNCNTLKNNWTFFRFGGRSWVTEIVTALFVEHAWLHQASLIYL